MSDRDAGFPLLPGLKRRRATEIEADLTANFFAKQIQIKVLDMTEGIPFGCMDSFTPQV